MPQLNILCIDDNSIILEIESLALELDPQIAVYTARTGTEALRLLVSDCRIDCILLDIVMPGECGQLLLGEVRTIHKHRETPVIFLTAMVDKELIEECVGLGAIHVLRKPFDLYALAGQIRGILGTDGP